MVGQIVRFRERQSVSETGHTLGPGRIPRVRGKLKILMISVSLSAIILGFFIFGLLGPVDKINTRPIGPENCFLPDCLLVQVFGAKWYWDFKYPKGSIIRGLLRVPVDTTVILQVTSRDVFHNFAITEFSLKTDAIPGRINTVSFSANEVRNSSIQCFELCGDGHMSMTATLQVTGKIDFENCCAKL